MKVIQGQSIFDIAVQELGSIEGAFELAMLNGISVTDELIPGQELILPIVLNKDIINYYANKGIKPATADNGAVESVDRVFFEELSIEFS